MIENPVEWLDGAQKPSYADKMMSSQSFFRMYYKKNDNTAFLKDLYKLTESLGDLSSFSSIQIENTPMFTLPEMSTPPMVLAFMQFLIQLNRPKRILEIGTFVGHSAIALASAMPADGHLITLEKFDHFAAIARRNIRTNGLQDRITIIEGDAYASLNGMAADTTFDMVFLDGNKERYKEYVEMVEPRVPPGGILIVDDVLMLGDVLNDVPQTHKGKGVQDMICHLRDSAKWKKIFLPISDGFLIAQRI